MPIYEFECQECHHQFEELVVGGRNETQCPACHSGQVKKLISTVAFRSGSHFASTASSGGCSGCSSTSCSTCK